MGVLPAGAFGEDSRALRMRVAIGLLYGDTDAQRELALAAPGPLTLPWIAAALDSERRHPGRPRPTPPRRSPPHS
jgi:aspartate aminotransferase